MLKHLFIEKTVDAIDTMIEEMEDREDLSDFSRIIGGLAEIREELTDLEEADG